MASFEQRLQQTKRDLENEVSSAKQHMTSNVAAKADFRDIDSLSQKLHAKLDVETAKNLISEAKIDLMKSMDNNKGSLDSYSK